MLLLEIRKSISIRDETSVLDEFAYNHILSEIVHSLAMKRLSHRLLPVIAIFYQIYHCIVSDSSYKLFKVKRIHIYWIFFRRNQNIFDIFSYWNEWTCFNIIIFSIGNKILYIDDYNDASHYIWKSKSKEFKLADIYLCYRQINFETSSECRKAWKTAAFQPRSFAQTKSETSKFSKEKI